MRSESDLHRRLKRTACHWLWEVSDVAAIEGAIARSLTAQSMRKREVVKPDRSYLPVEELPAEALVR